MAIDMLVDSAKLNREMKATANAIRTQGKTETDIPWEDEVGFEQAVLAIKGGADLNFEVVGGMYEPASPKENTIWVETDQEITGWVFSADEPSEPADGMVWFTTGTSSEAEFNALKESGIQIYPVFAKQYVGNAWDARPASIYQGSEWIEIGVFLYAYGNEYVNLTGGWISKAVDWDDGSQSHAGAPIVAREENKLVMSQTASNCGLVMTSNKIDITGYKTLRFRGKFYSTSTSQNAPYFLRLRLYSKIGTYVSENVVASINNNKNQEVDVYSLPLEGLTQTSVYVAFQLYDVYSHVELEKMWLEK